MSLESLTNRSQIAQQSLNRLAIELGLSDLSDSVSDSAPIAYKSLKNHSEIASDFQVIYEADTMCKSLAISEIASDFELFM